MQRKIRRADRVISEHEAKEILEQGEYGILSTVSSDGQPYGVPISYCYKDGTIYFHCAVEGHKLENLQGNNRVSFCVVGKTQIQPRKFGTKYESTIVFGKVFELVDAEKHEALLELLKKYSSEFVEQGLKYIETAAETTRVYKIIVESITGKSKK
jgi:nitroimidazol reductase NimA-like FMN-containing flavoprotein (pyridoxamine 5'-phosphate oxidase superfamily)